MKALSLHQPWASLIAEGVKTIETRSWRAPQSMVGQRFAVHAAKRMPEPRVFDEAVGDWEVWDNGYHERSSHWVMARKCAGIGLRIGEPDGGATCPGCSQPYALNGRGVMPRHAATDQEVRALPFGAVVATTRLVDCVPMVGGRSGEPPAGNFLAVYDDGRLIRVDRSRAVRGQPVWVDVSDQLPYGDFAPGRWASLLADVEKLDVPVPWKGRQGWFEVDLS